MPCLDRYGVEAEVLLQAIHNPVPKGGGWSASRFRRFYQLYKRLVGPQDRSGSTESLTAPRFDPCTVQSIAIPTTLSRPPCVQQLYMDILESPVDIQSRTLETDWPQHDSSPNCVIAQQCSSVAFVASRFQSRLEKFGTFQKCCHFNVFGLFKNCMSLKLGNVKLGK
jgi:hypothetical protein